ncbi:MAG: hypothetical protein ACLFRX_06225 [Gemmatimonadota bacterium]
MGFFGFVLTLVLGILALMAGLQWIRTHAEPRETPVVPPARLERLEAGLESLERRLDALQDQQRFLERLLEPRVERRRLPEGERVATEPDQREVREGRPVREGGEGGEGGEGRPVREEER